MSTPSGSEKLEIVYVPVSDLKPAEYNPRKWDEFQVKELTENIKKFGFRVPLLVNGSPERFNIVIGGHFRLHVAKILGMTEVPVVYTSIPSVEEEKELNLRLNKNQGEWDFDLLSKYFERDLLSDVGFTDLEIEKKIFALDDIRNEDLDYDFQFGTVNSWVRIGDFTAEIPDEKYQKIKSLIQEKGGLDKLIDSLTQ